MYRILIFTYTTISQIVFNEMHKATRCVIDEEFHLPQGLEYCKLNFTEYDPKITTFPGLYVVTAMALGPFELCDVYLLRYLSYFSGLISSALFYIVFRKFNEQFSDTMCWLSAINLSLLPPLFFFHNFYYTDMMSIMFIMLMYVMALNDRHFLSCSAGFMAILMRQTNVIWVAFIFGRYALNNYLHYCIKKKKSTENPMISTEDIRTLSRKDIKNVFAIYRLPVKVFLNCIQYFLLLGGFVAYIVDNGGIVVGDKSAHVAVVHVPQIFYFSLFCVFFGWPVFTSLVSSFLKHARRNKMLVLLALIVMGTIVHHNTLVHPYLLADNRHYTFYVWNRYYQRLRSFRYAVTAPYLFGFYCLIRHLYSPNDTTLVLVYFVATMLVLIPQKLVEIRYFLVPFVIFRLNVRNVTLKSLIIECIYYIIININTIELFFEKDIYWSDYDYPQKLIW